MTDSAPRRRITDPEVLKGLAQPIRQRLYRLLLQFGPATGGSLAKRLGADPGQVSYHLRELARRGFVEDVPELARDLRERWWRAAPGSTTWSFLDFAEPADRVVADVVKAQMVVDQFNRLRSFEQGRDGWSEAWLRAVMSSESFLRLTPEELSELAGELLATLTRWADATRGRPREDGRETVSVFFHAFPERDSPERDFPERHVPDRHFPERRR